MEKKPALEVTLVQEFVSKSHADLDRVKELLAQEPALTNSAWDWGGGDWETGLGAAAHMGRSDIASYLLKNGARLDLFAATMLGKLEIVKAALEAYPEAINIPGPHGIPLIAHAQAGGNAALQVYEYLKSLSSQNTEARIF
ncbi:MAG: ankyrin repeat domain-containing protein [Chloroflexi bacterium]|nr:MAG: ankyrin repeat domain-containing protein [Chloroflexota bacterium]